MKNLMKVLALVAVLAMAGTTFADWSLNATQGVAPIAGLESWTVSIVVPQGDTGPKSFRNTFVANVHQMNDDDRDVMEPTTYLSDFYDATEIAEWGKYDTHLLFNNEQVVGTQVEAETNDKSNPAGVGDYEYLPHAGIGEFSVTQAFAFGAPVADGFEFMQVVIPAGTKTTLTMLSDVNGSMVPMSVEVGKLVPEPSTILMLLAGSLCLLAIRRK